MINMIKETNPSCVYVGVSLIVFNLCMLAGGILGDPGVKE
jgi:hypothetical protein